MNATMNFTQAICSDCHAARHPDRKPHTVPLDVRERETCCLCGAVTMEGIYERIDPRTVKYPRGDR